MMGSMTDWTESAAVGLEAAIATFKRELPGWWFMLCECQVSCDATCAPTTDSPHIDLIEEAGDKFDAGFSVDLRQPATLADALMSVLEQAKEAIAARESQ